MLGTTSQDLFEHLRTGEKKGFIRGTFKATVSFSYQH